MSRRPNILIIMTDEERHPPHYEAEATQAYRDAAMPGRRRIREAATSFQRHYAAATACEPSRASFFTGQYPSLHGVSQTSGLAKSSSDPGLFWLPPNTVPTLGNWFQASGAYRCFYHGKWHISDQDLIVPGSHTGLLSNDSAGKPYPEREALYRAANRLADYGFDDWIGPEAHGSLAANSGTMRDPNFARQSVAMLDALEQEAAANPDYTPWLAVCSFVNPHDIVFAGQAWRLIGLPQPDLSGIPVMAPPTRHEDLCSKPRCQKDYVLNYGLFYYRQPTLDTYYQLYLYLQAEVDRHISAVYDKLCQCPTLAADTIVVFTSDHGELLGAHGGMHQKWYNAYDECLRVPLYVSTPAQRAGTAPAASTELLSSHVDLLPTLLDLAGIDVSQVAATLARSHTEVHPPVGRSLAPLLGGQPAGELPIYFMTDDEVDEGLNEISAPKISELFLSQAAAQADGWQAQLLGALAQRATQQPYRPVIEPHHIEAVLTRVDGTLYKLARYFENPRFVGQAVGNPDGTVSQYYVPDEWELYDLDADPDETCNLLSSCAARQAPADLVARLKAELAAQRVAKRKLPTTLNSNAGTAA